MSAVPPTEPTAIDSQHPWLGLASFTEETQRYFHGREEEVGELARRVQRTLLTVLFGQSGLGKTSILRAGIVPRLRPEGFCPVYVRIDYSADSPRPSEQIKQAIFRATESTGQWTQPGAAVEGESLWEFLHHRDDLLHDAAGKTIIPLLIFDQFEEIFTLAQADDAGRRRAQQFIEDLADLVENRPPKALEARLELDDTVSERFDFSRADYRILIALREDYLAHLESVKREMPSITQNRMRLARMNGRQALAAVMKPGGKLVSQEVAEAIVRFVAGGSELPNAEVEPSLLSLICRELNNTRIAQGKSEISADLLAGSHDTILAEFYERALADQPPAVRKTIEDELLTESGYRESIAEERLKKAFAAAGAAPDTLATLVNRRLLRIEERLDVRRVELTHDVLCGVVRASRELRLEREALDAAEKKLAAQKERERATRKALVRARQIAVACAVLAAGAVISALYGYQSAQRAQTAEANAQRVQKLAEASRGEAEKLVVYLLDDFYDELAPVGRLDAIGALAKSAVAYYEELPAELRTPATRRNHSQALLRRGGVLLAQGATEEAGRSIDAAEAIAARLREQGDASVETAFASARARAAKGNLLNRQADLRGALKAYREARAYLGPVLGASVAPSKAKLLELELLAGVGATQYRLNEGDAKQSLVDAQAYARKLNALDLSNLPATEVYLSVGQWLADFAYFEEGNAQAAVERAGEVAALADRVLERRPDHRPAMRAKGISVNLIARIDYDNSRVTLALKRYLEQHAVLERLVALDPSSVSAWIALGAAKPTIASMLRDLGRVDESLRWMEATVALAGKFKVDAPAARSMGSWSGLLAYWYENMGESGKAQAALVEMRKFGSMGKTGSNTDFWVDASLANAEARAMVVAGKFAEARAAAQQGIARMEAAEAGNPVPPARFRVLLWDALYEAAHGLGDYPAAEAAARRALELGLQEKAATITNIDQTFRNQFQTVIALALVQQGKLDQAREILAPLMAFYRQKELVQSEDNEQQVQRARFLMVYGMAFPAERKLRLAEAAAVFDNRPASIKRWREFAQIREEIAREMAKP